MNNLLKLTNDLIKGGYEPSEDMLDAMRFLAEEFIYAQDVRDRERAWECLKFVREANANDKDKHYKP